MKGAVTGFVSAPPGMQRGRCTEDEQLLASIIDTVPLAQQLHIFDARPKANAVANTAKGIRT